MHKFAYPMKTLSVIMTQEKGRGVFASVHFPPGALIESSEIIVIPASQCSHLDSTILYDYYFSWGEDHQDAAIALGYGSLYNHSYSPNARYQKNLENNTIDFFALKDIAAGEEITVNYNGDPANQAPLWFVTTEDTQ